MLYRGGLLRRDKFQERLLNHEIDYYVKDPKSAYGDVETVDGFSFNVQFGVYRKEKVIENDTNSYYGDKHALIHTGALRVRYDLLSGTPKQKDLALKFMQKFSIKMAEIQKSEKFKSLNFSYYSSRLLNSEIEKYSKQDTHYVILTFVAFWLTFVIAMWINSSSNKHDKKINNKEDKMTSFREYLSCILSLSLIKEWFYNLKQNCLLPTSLCLNGASFLPLVLLLQFVFSITSTYGFLSLIQVESNPITFTVIIILMSKFFYFFKILNFDKIL